MAVTLVCTVTTAQLVTEFSAPVTFTQYVPASLNPTFGIERQLLKPPGISTPSLNHIKLNGPRPHGAVHKSNGLPGHAVWLVGPTAVVIVCTVRCAQLVTEFKAPVTFT